MRKLCGKCKKLMQESARIVVKECKNVKNMQEILEKCRENSGNLFQ